MGSTGFHLTRIVLAAAAQRQIVLYDDVGSHQQPVFPEAWYWEKVATYSPCCNAGGAFGFGSWGLQPHRLSPPKRQRLTTHQCHWRCSRYERTVPLVTPPMRDQVQCLVNGLMYVVFWQGTRLPRWVASTLTRCVLQLLQRAGSEGKGSKLPPLSVDVSRSRKPAGRWRGAVPNTENILARKSFTSHCMSHCTRPHVL